MNMKLIATLSAVLALSGGAVAYSGFRDVVSPGTVYHPTTGGAGLAVCEGLTFIGFPTFCQTGGFGAFFLDIGCSNDANGNGVPDNSPGCLDDIDGDANGNGGTDDCVATDNGNDCDGKDKVAEGDCKVSHNTGTVSVAPAFFFVCGADRDDDNIVTDGDAASSTTGATPWDDDFELGNANGVTTASVPVCFARDRSTVGSGDDDWDDIVVFVGINFGNLPGASLVSLRAELVNVNSAAGPCSDGSRSSHDGSGNSNNWVA